MAIIRGDLPTDGYTIIDNRWFRDPRLTYKAKGLLGAIASHEAGYRLTVEQLIAETKDGRDAVRAGIAELESVGYLVRVPVRSRGNRISGYDFQLTAPKDVGISGAGNSVDGESGAGKPPTKKTTASKKTRAKKTTKDLGADAPDDDPQPVEKPVDKPKRGTRLPDGFQPDEAMRTWYRDNIGAKIDGALEHAKFCDYWAAQPGTKGVKQDWAATWRNWMRTAMQRAGNGGTQTKSFKQQDEERAAADAQARQERYQQAAVILEELVKQGKVKTQEPGQHLPDIDPGTGACRECELPEGNARHTVGLTSYERHTWTGRIAREMERRQTSGDVSDNGMASRTATPYIDGEWIEQAALGGGAP